MPPEQRRWIVLAAGVLANMCQGAAYTVSVFRGPMVDRLAAADPALSADELKFAIAVAVSLSFAFLPVGMLLAGRMADKGLGRWTVAAGALLFGSGLFLAGWASSATALWLTYGVMTSLGSGMAYGTIVGATVRWFPDRRGLAAGLAVAALGAGGMVISPVADALLRAYDVGVMFRVLGAASFVLMGFAAWFVANPPAGWTPKGFAPPASGAGTGGAGAAAGANLTWRAMLGTGRFYGLWALYFCGAFGGLLLIPQCKGLVVGEGGAEAVAVTAVMLLTAANSAGRLFWGWVSDRVGRWAAMGALLLAMGAGLGGIAAFTHEKLPTSSGRGQLITLGERTPAELLAELTAQTPSEGTVSIQGEPMETEHGPAVSVYFMSQDRLIKSPYSVPLVIASIMVVGLCFGGVLGMFPSLCAEAFGTANAGVNYGVLFTAFSAAALAAPQAASWMSLPAVLALAGAFAAAGFALVIALSRRNKAAVGG